MPGLLENIFGFGAEPGWGLDTITKSQGHGDFDAVLRFLGPEGPLLRLVYHLQTDVYLMYEYPFANLPVSSFLTLCYKKMTVALWWPDCLRFLVPTLKHFLEVPFKA